MDTLILILVFLSFIEAQIAIALAIIALCKKTPATEAPRQEITIIEEEEPFKTSPLPLDKMSSEQQHKLFRDLMS